MESIVEGIDADGRKYFAAFYEIARDHAGKNDVPDGIIGVSEYEYVIGSRRADAPANRSGRARPMPAWLG